MSKELTRPLEIDKELCEWFDFMLENRFKHLNQLCEIDRLRKKTNKESFEKILATLENLERNIVSKAVNVPEKNLDHLDPYKNVYSSLCELSQGIVNMSLLNIIDYIGILEAIFNKKLKELKE